MLADNIDELNPLIRVMQEERQRREPHWRAFRNDLVGVRWRRGTGTKRPNNAVYGYASTMLPMVAYRSPKVKLLSRYGEVGRLLARVYTEVLNNQIVDTKLLDVMRLGILDSFYSVGCFKTALVAKDDGLLVPYVEAVSPFRFLWDDTAKHWTACQAIGQEMCLLKDEVLNDPRYDLSGVNWDEVETSKDRRNEGGDDTQGKKRDDIIEELPEMVDLVELYLPDSKRLVTMLKKSPNDHLLIRSDPYYGRRTGPYHLLGYLWLDDAVMPIAPSHGWWEQLIELYEQEDSANKQIKQEKTVVAFPPEAGQSAKIMQEAEEHSFITGVTTMGKQATYGGITETKRVALLDKRQQFQLASGLTDTKRGASGDPNESATATFSKEQYGNITLSDLQDAIRNVAEEIVKDFLWWDWNDENVKQPISLTAPEMGIGPEPVDMVVSGGGENIGMSDADMVVEIKKDSMLRADGPMDRNNAIQEAGLILGPLTQIGMMLGYAPNFPEILKWLNEKLGRDDMEALFAPMGPIAMMMAMQGQAMGAQMPGMVGGAGSLDKTTMAMGGGGGGQGDLMRGVMGDSPMMAGAGMGAAPLSSSTRPPRSSSPTPTTFDHRKGE